MAGHFATLVAVFAVSGCAVTNNSVLVSMKADPMATWEPGNGALESAGATSHRERIETHYATLHRTWSMPDRESSVRGYREAVAAAQLAGWRPDPSVDCPRPWLSAGNGFGLGRDGSGIVTRCGAVTLAENDAAASFGASKCLDGLAAILTIANFPNPQTGVRELAIVVGEYNPFADTHPKC